jgi:hypothetical protein
MGLYKPDRPNKPKKPERRERPDKPKKRDRLNRPNRGENMQLFMPDPRLFQIMVDADLEGLKYNKFSKTF